jgi:putative endonuclease
MPAMYILRCNDGTFYVGSTWDLSTRVDQHIDGFGCEYTSKRKPVTLVYSEEFERRDEAWAREKQIQGWSHAKRLALVEGRLDDLRALSKSRASERARSKRSTL